MGRVLGLRQAGSQHLLQFLEHRLDVLLALQQGLRLGQAGCRAAVLALERLQRALRRFEQGLGVGQPGVAGVELFPFVGAGGELVHFADLPGQALTLALQRILRGAGVGQRALRGAPALPELLQRLGADAGIAVQQAAHFVGPGQALPGVLAMDVDQLFGQFAQLGGGRRAAVDPGPALALGVDAAAQEQAVLVFESGLLQPGRQRGRDVEFGADVGPRRAFAHHTGVGAGAQGQLQGVDEDRLAGAGFAGQDAEAARQVEIELADDDEVAQGDASEAHQLPSFQCSFMRRVSK